MMFPKHNYVRSKKLLEAAREISCQWCGADDGTVVAAHSNSLAHGKGRGIKADDNMIASLCYFCHAECDSGKMMTKGERQGMWRTAHERTVEKLTELGLWPDDVPKPKGFS